MLTQTQPSLHTQALRLLEGPAHGVAGGAVAMAHAAAVFHGAGVDLQVTAHVLQHGAREEPLLLLLLPLRGTGVHCNGVGRGHAGVGSALPGGCPTHHSYHI